MNALLAMQDFALIYEGTQRDAKTGAGVSENSVANYSYCARFTLAGSTEIGRVELELDRDGDGADLIVQIREGMDPATGLEGTLLKEVVVPKEFISTTKAYWSVPIGLSGLTSGAQYWLVVVRAGDATNKLDWVGETNQDASYPAYYLNNWAWEENNALHFKVFSGDTGRIRHGISGENGMTTLVHNESGVLNTMCWVLAASRWRCRRDKKHYDAYQVNKWPYQERGGSLMLGILKQYWTQ